jgi:hypothetical protein
MTKLLSKNQPWEWGDPQRQSYQALKNLMTEPGRILRPIDPKRELTLHTDWSNHGIGAVLGQKDDEGNEYLCACISRSLNKHEKNYPSYKGELLPLTWAVKTFRQHLHGTHFTIVTDHQPLLWLMKARDLTGQYSRWQMMLQEYDFAVIHRPGVKHNNADVLSRFPQKSEIDQSGARLDHEVIMMSVQKHIDDFCPRFRDLMDVGSVYVDRDTYSLPPQDRIGLAEGLQPMVKEVITHCKQRIRDEAIRVIKNLKAKTGSPPPILDQRVVSSAFFKTAEEDGITLIELCAGMATRGRSNSPGRYQKSTSTFM